MVKKKTARRKKRTRQIKTASGDKPTPAEVVSFACVYKQLSLGYETGSIGIDVSRQTLSTAEAVKQFVNRRSHATLTLTLPGGEDPDQMQLFDGNDMTVAGVFDITQFTCKTSSYGARLKVTRGEVDEATLGKFPKREGRIEITETDAIPKPQRKRKKDEEDVKLPLLDD